MKAKLGLIVLALCVGGCGEKTQNGISQFGQTVVDTTTGLEEAGADYSAKVYLTSDLHLTWTPFSFNSKLAGSYAEFTVKTGRGLGLRPSDVTTQPAPADDAAAPSGAPTDPASGTGAE